MSPQPAPDEGLIRPLVVLTRAELEVVERAHLEELVDDTGAPGAVEPDPVVTPGSLRIPTTPGDGSGSASRPLEDATPLTAAAPLDRVALAEARRSLVGRGLLTPRGALAVGSAPAELVRLVLDVRLSARAVVVAERFLGGSEDRPDLRLLHLSGDGGVVEDVHPDGLHGLDLCLDPDELTRAVVDAVVPPDARPGTGAPRIVDALRPDLLPERLDRPVLLAELTRMEAGQEDGVRCLLATGPSGSFLASRPGRGEQGRWLTFDPVEPERVGALVGGWVSQVVRPGA